MEETRSGMNLAGPGIMFISAAIFGFFGFMTGFPELTTTDPPQIIPMVVVLKWTLRAAAFAFFGCALLAMSQRIMANMLFALFGLATAGMFIVVAVWDITSVYYSGIHWFLLLLFAAWNGYGSWASLKEVLAAKRSNVAAAQLPVM